MHKQAIRLSLITLVAACAPANQVVGRAPENPTRELVRDPKAPDPDKRRADQYKRHENEADAAGPRVMDVVAAEARIGIVSTHMFHRPDCSLIAGAATADEIRFTNKWDALNNGAFRPCSECRPEK